MCPYEEKITSWLLNDLPPDEQLAVARHLDACPACRAVRDDLAHVLAPLASGLAKDRRVPLPAAPVPSRARAFWLRRHTALKRAALLALSFGSLFALLSHLQRDASRPDTVIHIEFRRESAPPPALSPLPAPRPKEDSDAILAEAPAAAAGAFTAEVPPVPHPAAAPEPRMPPLPRLAASAPAIPPLPDIRPPAAEPEPHERKHAEKERRESDERRRGEPAAKPFSLATAPPAPRPPLPPVRVAAARSPLDTGFALGALPPPAANDAAAGLRPVVVDGELDPNSAPPDILTDGRLPSAEDQPRSNLFFKARTPGGRLRIDLPRPTAVRQINTYSWHTGSRAPQVYTLYAADGADPRFNPAPKRGTDPLACGWQHLADIDTRPADAPGGGQHAVSVSRGTVPLGTFRHLLFDIRPTDPDAPFSNTFYSEIDILDADGPAPVSAVTPVQRLQTAFTCPQTRCRFTLDATDAPDLAPWAENTLAPILREWYPKITALLSGDGHQPPSEILLLFRNDMGGTPASAADARVNLNAAWFRRERDREAPGAVIHELVHIVQGYGRAPVPGWVTEGLADYVRWFLYEPHTRGAELSPRQLASARHDSSYRVSANFIDWAARTHNPDLPRKLNAAARQGRYADALWQEWTRKPLPELESDWLKAAGK